MTMEERCRCMVRQLNFEVGRLRIDCIDLKLEAEELLRHSRCMLETTRRNKHQSLRLSSKERHLLCVQLAQELRRGEISGSIRAHFVTRQETRRQNKNNLLPSIVTSSELTSYQLEKMQEAWLSRCEEWMRALALRKYETISIELLAREAQQHHPTSVCELSLNEIPLRHISQLYPHLGFKRPSVKATSSAGAAKFYENEVLRPLRRRRQHIQKMKSELFCSSTSSYATD